MECSGIAFGDALRTYIDEFDVHYLPIMLHPSNAAHAWLAGMTPDDCPLCHGTNVTT